MNDTQLQAFEGSIGHILEDLVFLFPSPMPAPAHEHGLGNRILVHMTYSGAHNGKLAMDYPDSFSTMVAANMLGLDEDDPDIVPKSEDAIRELLNVICGNLLPALYGSEAVFSLGIPEIIPSTDAPEDMFSETATTIWFEADDAILRFQYSSENSAAS
jgi:hypothetical protein